MGGMFGGGGSKKSSSSGEKSTTADSIETADGTVYDRRGTTTAAAATPPTGTIPSTLAAPTMDPMEKVMSNRVASKKQSPAGTLAGQSGYGFG
jgi:hypothetical protein